MFEKLDLTFTRKIFKQKASTNTELDVSFVATSILPIFTYLMNWIFYLGPLPPRLELWSIVLGAVVHLLNLISENIL